MSDTETGPILCIRKKLEDEAPWLMALEGGDQRFCPLRTWVSGKGRLVTFTSREIAEHYLEHSCERDCVICEVSFGINCLSMNPVKTAKAA